MFEKIKGAARAVKDTVGNVVGAGFETVKGQIDELSEMAPALEQVGYHVTQIDLDFTLPPRVVIHLSRDADKPDEAFQAVLANNAGKRTFCTLVALLRQANNLIGKTQIKGRALHDVEVSLGLPPGLKLKYT